MYFIAFDRHDVIWGVGVNPEEALKDARKSLEGSRPKLKTVRCTKEMYEDISENGYCHGDDEPYWHYNDICQCAYYPEKIKRRNVFNQIK